MPDRRQENVIDMIAILLIASLALGICGFLALRNPMRSELRPPTPWTVNH